MESSTAHHSHKLVLISTDDSRSVEVTEAARTDPALVREILLRALSLIPLDDPDLIRIQALERFRRSLAAERNSTPYRLQAVVAACQSGNIPTPSLEAKFYEHGGIRALAALAATVTDDKHVVPLLEKLSDQALNSLLQSIDNLEVHGDLAYLSERIRRKKQRAPSKRVSLPGPRQRRRPSAGPPKGTVPSNQNLRRMQRQSPMQSSGQNSAGERSETSSPRIPTSRAISATTYSNPRISTTGR